MNQTPMEKQDKYQQSWCCYGQEAHTAPGSTHPCHVVASAAPLPWHRFQCSFALFFDLVLRSAGGHLINSVFLVLGGKVCAVGGGGGACFRHQVWGDATCP